jgi:hypothetical protein
VLLECEDLHVFVWSSVHSETMFVDVILRSKATKNLMVVWPERFFAPLRMTLRNFRMETSLTLNRLAIVSVAKRYLFK